MSYTIGKEVMKFISKNSEIEQVGHGHITIACDELWNMSDEDFKKEFIEKVSY